MRHLMHVTLIDLFYNIFETDATKYLLKCIKQVDHTSMFLSKNVTASLMQKPLHQKPPPKKLYSLIQTYKNNNFTYPNTIHLEFSPDPYTKLLFIDGLI